MNVLRKIIKILYRHAIGILLVMIILASMALYYLRKEDIKLPISKPKYHFYFIAQNSVDPFWIEVIRGVEDSARDNNVVVEFYAPRFNDPMEELKYIDIATISKVDGIITHVSNMVDFTEVINKASDNNIPVITFENDDSESKRKAFVGTNSFIIGKEAAKLMVEATGGTANIAIISSSDSNQGLVEHNLKMNGFISTLKDYPNMNIVKNYTSKMGILSAEEITQTILDSKEKIDAIFTVSSADTLGCAQFIVDRNKVGSISLVGYGSSEEILRYIDKEIIFGTVASDPYKMGYESLRVLSDIKDGNSVPNFVDTEVEIITKGNLEVIKERREN